MKKSAFMTGKSIVNHVKDDEDQNNEEPLMPTSSFERDVADDNSKIEDVLNPNIE